MSTPQPDRPHRGGHTAGRPSREQVLNLVERAERRVISPAEAEVLRTEVLALLTEASERAAAVEALRLFRVERNAAVLELAVSGSLSLECGFCGVDAGQRCVTVSGWPARMPHWVRLQATSGVAA